MTRNLSDLGVFLQKIVDRLQHNQDLLKLLYYTEKDPLSELNLTTSQITNDVFNKLIKIVPRIDPKETAQSIISIRVVSGSPDNSNGEVRVFQIGIEVFVPLTQWIIKDSNLRPFAIMGEIHKSLHNKEINGLGRISGGDFQLKFLTDEIGCYEMNYYISSYD